MRATLRRAVRELANPLGLVAGKDDPVRARRDAWRWLVENRATLREQRARTLPAGERRYDEAVEAIQSRSAYYGWERPEVVALVPASAKYVIDVGCASGALGAALKRGRPGVEVRGIEPFPEAAARAKKALDDVAIAPAEAPLPASWPRPDCVVFADVLEHLVDPAAVLKRYREVLAPGGSIVVSLPNVAHREPTFGLALGAWEYKDAGILNRTHLRFYTRKTALELLAGAGFEVVEIRRAINLPPGRARKAMARWAAREPLSGAAWPAARLADLCTVQFLVVAR